MTRAILFLLCLPLLAQEPRWAVSLVDQGRSSARSTLGRRAPKDIAVFDVTLCSGNEAISLPAATVLREIHSRGLVVFSAGALDAIVKNTSARSIRSILADVGELTTIGGAVITNAQVITIRDDKRAKYAFGLAMAAGLFHFLHGKVAGATLEPDKVAGFVLPDPANLAARQDCWNGQVLGLKPDKGSGIAFEVR